MLVYVVYGCDELIGQLASIVSIFQITSMTHTHT
jgi:hypothetical protein